LEEKIPRVLLVAIDKGLYTAPAGLDLDAELPEVEIELPEMIENDDGSVEITLVGGTDIDETIPFEANLADYLTDDELAGIADEQVELVEADIDSRSEWVDTYVAGLEILGLNYEERVEPWEGACGVSSTVLAEAVMRFQAETMSEVYPAAGPVKTKIIGIENKEKEEAAMRVKVDMNYQLTEVMSEYRTEHEKLLWSLALAGSAFKKVYFDPILGRQVAPFLNAEDVIVPYGATVIEHAERVTHVMRKTINEVESLQASGFYAAVDLNDPESFHTDIEEKKAEEAGFELDEDDRYCIYEIHAQMVIPGVDEENGLAKPYILTVERGSNAVLGLRRNWLEDDPLQLKRQHFVHYIYVPAFGFYGLGLINIIGGYARAGTSLIRQLVDAGTLSNLPGGLKSRDLRTKGEDTPIGPGEWRDVDVPSGAIKDHLIPLPYKEPSQTLAGLLDKITQEGRRLGAIADMDISDMSANAPVGTTLALLERQLKPMAAIHARIHYAMKQEFKLLKAIISENAPMEYIYQPETGDMRAKQADYVLVEVIPVSDPNSSTMAQRVVQYQAVLQMAEQSPEIYDLPLLHRQMIEVLGVKNADKLVPTSEDAEPTDPISENMGALVGTPMKAFLYQDHDAHISTHMSFMQDPMIAKLIGQNPKANEIMSSLQAHVAEHLGYSYRTKMEEKLGVTLPPPGETLPEEVEVMLSRAVADAGKQLAEQHKQEDAQKEAKKAEEDPNLALARQAEETKRMEVDRKTKKDQADVGLRKDEQQRKRANDVVTAELKLEEVAQDRRATEVEAVRADTELADERDALDKRTSIETLKALLGAQKDSGQTGGQPPSE
jgi:hypothetical protein